MGDQTSILDEASGQDKEWTVAALTSRIGAALGDFGPLSVVGEVSQAKVYPSGHLYLTLKDSEAVLSVVMWRSQVVRNGPLPKEGMQALVRGSLSVYGPRGQYQLQARSIRPLGAGGLAQRFEELKARLLAEGLFDEERKRPLPLLPRAIGLATASGSAALADMLHSLRARFPRMPIVHAPCLVQGSAAAASIVAALRRLQAHPDVDVIICGRGGGSLEDLWAFNEEPVVRAIAACRVPVISAVGHETDTTLADFAADVRAKTPTAAGELVVPEAAELEAQLAQARRRLGQLATEAMATARARLHALAHHRALASPGHALAMRRQRLDELGARLGDAARAALEAGRGRLAMLAGVLGAQAPARALSLQRERHAASSARMARALEARLLSARRRWEAGAAQLEALSPLAVLGRGYAVVFDHRGGVVRTRAQAPAGARIAARIADGWLDASVDATRPVEEDTAR
jgi:exodeoxyribonuclease VII large subunit